MPFWSAPEREPLLRPAVFIVLALVIVIGMLAVFPNRETFMRSAVEGKPDDVSVAYLRLFLRTGEGDPEMVLTFAEQLRVRNRTEEAKDVLRVLAKMPGPQRLESRYRLFRVRWEQYNDQSFSGYYREFIREKILLDLDWLAEGMLSAEQLEDVARVALQIGRPLAAAPAYVGLARVDPLGRPNWLEQAARSYLAGGRPDEAARTRARACEHARTRARGRERTIAALRTYIAADLGEEGLEFARRAVEAYPDAADVVEWCFTLARAQGEVALAREWGRLLVDAKWDDPEFIELQLRLELAGSEDERARFLAERLVDIAPDSAEHRALAARLSEWAGLPEVALRHRMWLARRYADDPNLERALSLSSSLYRYRIYAELLELRSQWRKLDEVEVRMLVEAHEGEGEPEKATHYLEDYVERYPQERFALELLAELYDNLGRPWDSLKVFEEIDWRFGSTLEDITRRAKYHWRLDQLELALSLLRTHQPEACPGDQEYWSLLASLAWNLEADEVALEAHRTLWRHGHRTAAIADHLILLERGAELHESALKVAVEAYEQFHLPRHLVQAMESAARRGLWKEARALVRLAAVNEAPFLDFEYYLLLRARLYDRDGDVGRARAYYQLALERNPRSRYARPGMLWMLINHGRRADLGAYLAGWQDEAVANSDLWPPFAAGLQLLSRVHDSLPWYRLQAEKTPDDYLWLLHYAEALDQVGQPNAAFRLRRFVLQEVLPKQRLELAKGSPGEIDPVVLRRYAVLTRDVMGFPSGDAWVDEFLESFGLGDAADDGDGRDDSVAWLMHRGGLGESLGFSWEKAAANTRRLAWRMLTLSLDEKNLRSVAGFFRKAQEESAGEARPEAVEVEEEFSPTTANSPWSYTDRITLAAEGQKIGDLRTGGFRTEYEARAGRYRFALSPGLRFFHSRELELGDRRWEADYSSFGELRRPRWTAWLRLGANQQEPETIVRAVGAVDWRWNRSFSSRLFAAFNEESTDSTAVRIAGARHRISTSVHGEWNRRMAFDAELGAQRVHARSGSEMAVGYTVEGAVRRRLRQGEHKWEVRVAGLWNENSVEDRIPSSLESLFAAPPDPTTIVPNRFGLFLLGTTLWNRDPDGALLDWPGLRYRVDGFVGWLIPEDEVAFELRGELGLPITQNDELGLSLMYSDSAGGLAGQDNASLSLFYRWEF